MPNTNPLRLFASLQPRLATAHDGMMFASGDRGSAGGYEPVQGGADLPDDVETPATRGPRGDQGNIPAGRQRTVHFQPEDRYWTDYLRIALPVIGLVLMLGLFWYWASTFIGGSNKQEPVSTQAPGQAVIANTASSPTAAATKVVTTTANTPSANTATTGQRTANTPAVQSTRATTGNTNTSSTSGGDNQAANGGNQATGSQGATQPASANGTFAAGDTVTVTADTLNLRDGPTATGTPLTTLSKGDSLTIVSGPEQGDNYSWYQVKTSDGTEGWVASDFIAAASQ